MNRQFLLLAGVCVLTLIAYFSYHYLSVPESGAPQVDKKRTADSIEPSRKPSRPPIGIVQPLPREMTNAAGESIAVIDLSVLQEGDPVSFYIPQEDETYSGIVDETDVAESGIRSVIGLFDVEGDDYRFVFTIGNKFTFGTLHTPAGRYQMQSKAGVGHLIAATDTRKQHSSVVPDYVMPKSPTRQ